MRMAVGPTNVPINQRGRFSPANQLLSRYLARTGGTQGPQGLSRTPPGLRKKPGGLPPGLYRRRQNQTVGGGTAAPPPGGPRIY